MSSRYGRGADAFLPAQTNYIDPITGSDISGLFGILNAYTEHEQHTTKNNPNNITINTTPVQKPPAQIIASQTLAPRLTFSVGVYFFIILVLAIFVANSISAILDIVIRTIGRELREYLLLRP
jgi:hypothetical protein